MAEMVEVFFATNRNWLKDEDPPFGNTFHTDGTECYRVGKALVAKEGDSYALSSTEVEEESTEGSGDDVDSKLGSAAVFRQIKQRMQDGDRDMLVLIHGYAANLGMAAERAAELSQKYLIKGKDGKERQPVAFAFSWPANGRMIPFKSYMSDREDAAKSGRAIARLFMRLCDFLLKEARESRRATDDDSRLRHAPCPNRIHLVAHSMGNWALRHAMQGIIDMRGADRIPAVFDNIFLMAADVDEDALQDPNKLGLLSRLGNAVHVYYSKDDQGLVISDVTKLNPDRLGSNGPVDMAAVDEKIIVIDCRHVDDTNLFDANHQYYRLREEVVADVKQVLAGFTPGEIVDRRQLEHPRRHMIMRPARRRRRATPVPTR